MHNTMDWETVQRDIEQKIKEKPADDVKKKIVIPNPVPVGNRLAHFIRSIHWNSKGMLPSTAGSKRSYDKYRTVTSLSFQGPDGFAMEQGEASGGFLRKKETIEDIMLSPRTQMFNRWKIPDRMVDSAPSPRRELVTPAQSEASVRPPSVQLPGKRTPAPAPASRMSREMSREDVPNIRMKGAVGGSRTESRNGLQPTTPMKLSRSMTELVPKGPMLEPRSKTMVCDFKKPGTADKNGFAMGALVPEAVPQAEEWMKKADKADKAVIERILKMASKKNKLESSLKRTLLPDAKDSVEKWLGHASENERQVALEFFNSLAGSQLMGMTVDSQRKRLKEVISTLEDAKPTHKFYGTSKRNFNRNRKEMISDGKLKYIRLLTPNTRENHWMHTTWHHLPEHKDHNIVDNRSSHYIRPHAPAPRHFVIHPDWG